MSDWSGVNGSHDPSDWPPTHQRLNPANSCATRQLEDRTRLLEWFALLGDIPAATKHSAAQRSRAQHSVCSCYCSLTPEGIISCLFLRLCLPTSLRQCLLGEHTHTVSLSQSSVLTLRCQPNLCSPTPPPSPSSALGRRHTHTHPPLVIPQKSIGIHTPLYLRRRHPLLRPPAVPQPVTSHTADLCSLYHLVE